jgi:uncharacterized protein YkwD/PKD repeat protein
MKRHAQARPGPIQILEAAAVGAALLLAGCADPTAVPAARRTLSAGCPLSQLEFDVASLLNQHRIADGLTPVEIDVRLDAAALLHSQSMEATGELSHQTSQETLNFSQRMLAQGYPSPFGELIASTTAGVAQQVADLWLNSAPPLAVIEDSRVRHLGIGRAGNYWTVDIGSDAGAAQIGGCLLNGGNQAPVLGALADLRVDPGATGSIALSATDPDGDPVTFSATGLPAFGSLTDHGDGTGQIDFAPLAGDVGLYSITVQASDGSLASTGSFTLRVGNRAPVINAPASVTVVAGTTATITVAATDPDADPVTLSLASGPAFASLADGGSGQATVTLSPAAADAGTTTSFVVNASDGAATASATVQVTIAAADPLCNVYTEVLNALNNARTAGGVAPLALDARLTASALGHAQAMAAAGQLAIQLPGEPAFDQRILAAGYPTPAGEFVALAGSSGSAVAAMWIGDAAHLALLLTPGLTHVGVGFAGAGSVYWTADLGGSTLPAQPVTCGPTQVNRPPVAGFTAAPSASLEGDAVAFAEQASDPDGDALTYGWDFGDGGTATGGTPSHVYADEGTYLVTLTVQDGNGGTGSAAHSFTVSNAAPVPGAVTAPVAPIGIGTPFTVTIAFADPGVLDHHTGAVDWGDGASSSLSIVESGGSGQASASHGYAAPGVYTLAFTINDGDGGTSRQEYSYVVAFDPSGGFVTGGGWIVSPPGAYAASPGLSGKATFGFVSRYVKGKSAPVGNTEFSLSVGGFAFESASYDVLVVSGPRAQFRGTGLVNGGAGYAFMISVRDGAIAGDDSDRFRIKVWNHGTGVVVYDNEMGGNITIHPAK